MTTLYITIDGLLDPLGASQIVPYVEGLGRRGRSMTVLSFEKPERWADPERREALRERLAAAGVEWLPQRYRSGLGPLSAYLNVRSGAAALRARFGRNPPALVHVRSYLPGWVALKAGEALGGAPLLFDMRGFFPDERVDGGLWRRGGVLYRLVKRLERRLLRESAGVVTLTRASLPVLEEWMARAGSEAVVEVIPTCADLERFRPRESGASPDPPGFVYFGSIGSWYLLEEMVELVTVLLERVPGSRAAFLVNQGTREVRSLLPAEYRDRVAVESVAPERLGERLRDFSAAFHLIRPAPSKRASAATKVGEALATGLPVLANAGVGDVERQLQEGRVGVVLREFTREAYAEAADRLMELLAEEGIVERCRAYAEAHLSKEWAVERYDALYDRLGAPRAGPEDG